MHRPDCCVQPAVVDSADARSGISIALVIVVVAEMFIGSANGMGRRIIDAQQVFDLKQMYASIIATGCLGYGLNILFLGLERHFVKWAGR
jgi:NitT/TauT family transport system permease protein